MSNKDGILRETLPSFVSALELLEKENNCNEFIKISMDQMKQ